MAEPTNQGTDPKGNPIPTGGGEPPKDPPSKADPPAPSVEEQIKTALAQAKAEWDKDLGEKLKEAKEEGARLAKLSAAERQKEEDKAAMKKLEQEKADFAHTKLVYYAENQLAKSGLPTEIAEYLTADNEDNTKAVIDKIKSAFDKAVEAGVTEKLKGKTPPLGGSNPPAAGGFMDAIRENQR